MVALPQEGASGRRSGGVKEVRPAVWRVDVELPRSADESRRRVSKTVAGTRKDAERALDELVQQVRDQAVPPRRRSSHNAKTASKRTRERNSGAISMLARDRWLIGVEGARDPVTGARRRHTRVVLGSREQADIALARLRLVDDDGLLDLGTNAKSVRSACDLYLAEARTELQTVRTDRSARRRLCSVVLPGGGLFGDVPLSKVGWQMIERVFAKLEAAVQPQTHARYASSLSKVLEHAKRIGWIRQNPARDARRPKVPSRKPDVPHMTEVRAALAHAREHDLGTYAYVMGLATIGCRWAELLAVRHEDVNLDDSVVTIRASLADGGPGVGIYRKTTKRDDWRDVPLTPQMVSVFRELFAARLEVLRDFARSSFAPDAYVFSDSPDGSTWLRPDTTSARWLAARGSSKVTFAMLRRYVATQLLDVTNGDYRTVASITGNSEETLRRWYDAGANIHKKRAVVELAQL